MKILGYKVTFWHLPPNSPTFEHPPFLGVDAWTYNNVHRRYYPSARDLNNLRPKVRRQGLYVHVYLFRHEFQIHSEKETNL